MGLRDWFSSKSEEEEDTLRRYLCSLEKSYQGMDEFMEEFSEIMNLTIEKYSEANPVNIEEYDPEKAYKSGSRWIYQAEVQRLDEEGQILEEARGGFLKKRATFNIVARSQPEFAIELSGSKSLTEPFLENLEAVLKDKGIGHQTSTIAEPGLGKADETETEPAA